MVFSVAACGETTTIEQDTAGDSGDTATTEAQEQNPTASLGDTVTAGDMAFTLTGVRLSEGDEFLAPESGEKWVVFDGTWENRGSEAEVVSSLGQLTLRVGGRDQDFTFTGDENGSLDGDVLPGSSLSGELAFVVAEGATEGEFLVAADFFGTPVVYKVTLP
jgi:hypothetical protein